MGEIVGIHVIHEFQHDTTKNHKLNVHNTRKFKILYFLNRPRLKLLVQICSLILFKKMFNVMIIVYLLHSTTEINVEI